jgi:hypothetical protein
VTAQASANPLSEISIRCVSIACAMWSSQGRINSVSKIRMRYRLHQRVISSRTINPCNPRTQCCDGLPESFRVDDNLAQFKRRRYRPQTNTVLHAAATTNPIGALKKPVLCPVLSIPGFPCPSSTTNDMGRELGGRRQDTARMHIRTHITHVNGIIIQGCYIQLVTASK